MTEGFMLDQELSRQVGVTCHDCSSKTVVYSITVPYPPAFPAGGYCYPHLLERCRCAKMFPFPIETGLLDRLQGDLGLGKIKKWYFFK